MNFVIYDDNFILILNTDKYGYIQLEGVNKESICYYSIYHSPIQTERNT